MKKIIFQVLRIVFLLLILYTVGVFISFFVFGGMHIDFPCFVEHDEVNRCVEHEWEGNPDRYIYQIEVFLNEKIAGAYGASCLYKYTDDTVFDMDTFAMPLHLEVDGDNLIVNGEVLEAGEEFERTRVVNWNPWKIARVRVRNLGMVGDCNSEIMPPRVVAVGVHGTGYSWIKGLSVLFVAIVGFVFTHIKIRRAKRAISVEG